MTQVTAPIGFTAMPAGIVLDYAGTTAPAGTVFCDGSSLLRSTYAALFAVCGSTYGSVDGTHFNVPDLRGRATFGKDNMGGSTASRVTNAISGITGTTLGAVGGDQRLTAHTHTIAAATGGQSPDTVTAATNYWTNGSTATSAAGSGASENMPPALIVNKIITTGGV